MSDFAIETNQLAKRFGNILLVDAVNLRVKLGEIYGLLGLNGPVKDHSLFLFAEHVIFQSEGRFG
jgi:ABC-type uncharacterized transport system ATPase subunit